MTMSTTTTSPIPLTAGRWTVDYAHTSIEFSVRHLGVSKVRGRFNTFTAEVMVGSNLATSSLDASVALGSIDTGNHDRDASVQSPHLVDVARRPTLTFRSTSISALDDDGSYAITGDVTIGDVTRPVTLHAEFGGVGSAPDGVRHAGFEAVADLHRKEFGIGVDIPGAMVGDVVKIQLDVQLIEPQSPVES
jgi:polyisoprenoid-binding protein YceI